MFVWEICVCGHNKIEHSTGWCHDADFCPCEGYSEEESRLSIVQNEGNDYELMWDLWNDGAKKAIMRSSLVVVESAKATIEHRLGKRPADYYDAFEIAVEVLISSMEENELLLQEDLDRG